MKQIIDIMKEAETNKNKNGEPFRKKTLFRMDFKKLMFIWWALKKLTDLAPPNSELKYFMEALLVTFWRYWGHFDAFTNHNAVDTTFCTRNKALRLGNFNTDLNGMGNILTFNNKGIDSIIAYDVEAGEAFAKRRGIGL